MKLIIITLSLTSLLLTSCRKEGKTNNKFHLFNYSGVTVKIQPTTTLLDTLILLNDESKKYDLSTDRALGTGINYATFADGKPVTVIFNDSDTIIHYFDTLTHTGRYYKLNSNRSFYNTESYQKEIVTNSNHIRTATLTYIFTAQDYLDAKK